MDVAPAATSTAAASMDMTMSMSTVFFTATDTPLYSSSWVPTTIGAYAGNCIFLIVLSVVFRVLYAIHSVLQRRWLARSINMRDIVVGGVSEGKRSTESLTGSDRAPENTREGTTQQGSELETAALLKASRAVKVAQPWRWSVDLPRACLVTVMSGVGYLL